MSNEKRKHQRYAVFCATEIETGEPQLQLGVTKDLSRSGARLMTLAPIEEGVGIQLKIALGDFEKATWCPARVVRNDNVNDYTQLWRNEVSIVFNDILPEDVELGLDAK